MESVSVFPSVVFSELELVLMIEEKKSSLCHNHCYGFKQIPATQDRKAW